MKRWVCFVLALLLAFPACVSAAGIEVKRIEGIREHTFEHQPFVEGSGTEDPILMVPLRETMEALGYRVDWSPGGKITMTKGYLRASLVVGADAYTNRYDQRIALYQNPVYKGNLAYVPHIFFYYVLGYDCFLYRDSLVIRNHIENIVSKYAKTDHEDAASHGEVEIVYPALTSKTGKYDAINRAIEDKVREMRSSNRGSLHLTYDIGVFNRHVLSVIFSGERTVDGASEPVLDALNIDMRTMKPITPADVFRSTGNIRSDLVRQVLRAERTEDSAGIRFEDLSMYFLGDAMVLFTRQTGKGRPIVSRYFKLDELLDVLTEDFRPLLRNFSYLHRERTKCA